MMLVVISTCLLIGLTAMRVRRRLELLHQYHISQDGIGCCCPRRNSRAAVEAMFVSSHVPRNSTISAPFKITNTIRMMIVVSRYIPWRFVDGVASGRWYVHLNFTDRSSVSSN